MFKSNIVSLVLVAFTGGAHAQATDHSGMDHSGMDHGAHMANISSGKRQADVAQRGKDVMPFSLAATSHIFTKTSQGGIQKVLVKNANDTEQLKLTRLPLREIREQFIEGDFSGPTYIHGHEMPGLAVLMAARPGQIAITYADLEGGAELGYTTTNATLVSALHQWFDAQVGDHGKDAMAGHGSHGAMRKP